MSDSPPHHRRKAYVIPSHEAWTATFQRINTPAIRALIRGQLRKKFQHNADAFIDILLPDIARTLAVKGELSDAKVRSFITSAVHRAVSNETQRGTEAGTKKREVPYWKLQEELARIVARANRREEESRSVLEEEREVVANAARQLNKRQKQMLAMALEGRDAHAMAAAFGISLNAAQTAWYHVVARLKEVARAQRTFHVRPPRKGVRPTRARRGPTHL